MGVRIENLIGNQLFIQRYREGYQEGYSSAIVEIMEKLSIKGKSEEDIFLLFSSLFCMSKSQFDRLYDKAIGIEKKGFNTKIIFTILKYIKEGKPKRKIFKILSKDFVLS